MRSSILRSLSMCPRSPTRLCPISTIARADRPSTSVGEATPISGRSGRSRLGLCVAVTQDLAIDLTGGGLWQGLDERNNAREFVLAEMLAREGLKFLDQARGRGAARHDKSPHHQAADLVWNADYRHLRNGGMLHHDVFDFGRAH